MAKKGLNIAANICAIVLSVFMIFGAYQVLALLAIVEIDTMYSVVCVALIVLCVALIIVASIASAKNKGNGLGLKIAMIAMMGILAILEFVGGGILYGVLCLIPIGLEIASLCIKTNRADMAEVQQEPVAVNQARVAVNQQRVAVNQQRVVNNAAQTPLTVEQKIAELKHLKELRAISDEQYENAISAIVNDLK